MGVIDVSNYDFIEFPGVVYRTFISSLMVAAVAWPFKPILDLIGLSSYHMHLLCKATFLVAQRSDLSLARQNIFGNDEHRSFKNTESANT